MPTIEHFDASGETERPEDDEFWLSYGELPVATPANAEEPSHHNGALTESWHHLRLAIKQEIDCLMCGPSK